MRTREWSEGIQASDIKYTDVFESGFHNCVLHSAQQVPEHFEPNPVKDSGKDQP